jgi:hypothetical protein
MATGSIGTMCEERASALLRELALNRVCKTAHQPGKVGNILLSPIRKDRAQHDRTGSSQRQSRTGPMLGLKRSETAAITLAGVELMRRIYKLQFDLSKLRIKDSTAPEVWNTVLEA